MRNITVAILSLSSFMLHAQASTPAQTQVAADGTASVRRISTGVTTPKLVYKVDVVSSTPEYARQITDDTKVVVGMIVDKSGKPSDLKILKSAGAAVDASVLAAVAPVPLHPWHGQQPADRHSARSGSRHFQLLPVTPLKKTLERADQTIRPFILFPPSSSPRLARIFTPLLTLFALLLTLFALP